MPPPPAAGYAAREGPAARAAPFSQLVPRDLPIVLSPAIRQPQAVTEAISLTHGIKMSQALVDVVVLEAPFAASLICGQPIALSLLIRPEMPENRVTQAVMPASAFNRVPVVQTAAKVVAFLGLVLLSYTPAR